MTMYTYTYCHIILTSIYTSISSFLVICTNTNLPPKERIFIIILQKYQYRYFHYTVLHRKYSNLRNVFAIIRQNMNVTMTKKRQSCGYRDSFLSVRQGMYHINYKLGICPLRSRKNAQQIYDGIVVLVVFLLYIRIIYIKSQLNRLRQIQLLT